LTAAQREAIRALATDLHSIWNVPVPTTGTDHRERCVLIDKINLANQNPSGVESSACLIEDLCRFTSAAITRRRQ
jgi:hypothetical protein